MNEESWSVRRVLKWATDDFQRRANPSPRLDAELLLGAALSVERIKLFTEPDRLLEDPELARYRELIKRRRTGEPMAYILGQREFFGLPMQVDGRVLIPRADTETLVEAAVEVTHASRMFGRMLDLCTGSGCVAIAFAKQRPTWRVTALDISRAALDVAENNALRSGTIWGMRFVAGDLFEPLAAAERFELVTANPPYIPSLEIPGLAADIRDFEPRVALDGGSDGLVVLRALVAGALPRLVPGGTLAVEMGSDQAVPVRALFEAAGFAHIEVRRDLAGRERVVLGRRASPASALSAVERAAQLEQSCVK